MCISSTIRVIHDYGQNVVKTVNLVKVSQGFSGKAVQASNYKRLQRFLRGFELDYEQCAKILAKLFCPEEPWVLSLDRTNWQFGELDINFLVLGVAYKGICIPLFWSLLPKRGNSNTDERIELMDRFLSAFTASKIEVLTADREFKGKQWLRYLRDNRIPFCIRIVENTLVWNKQRNRQLPVRRYFSLTIHEQMVLNKQRKVWGVLVHLSCVRSPKGRVILISSDTPKDSIARYKLRWSIETLFGCLKTRGFNLEDTHVQDLGRLKKLFFILVITFAWCHKVGIWLTDLKPVKIKKHGRPAKSIFRVGLDHICSKLLSKSTVFRDFEWLIRFLSCT